MDLSNMTVNYRRYPKPALLQPQKLNVAADLVSIQDLYGHSRIKPPQRHCNISNHKVQWDYFRAVQGIEASLL